ncbi:MAG: thiol-disulfide oxidoreductase DCC family protein [Pirellulales bacterium]
MSKKSRSTRPEVLLPSPADRPRSEVVIYDGHCRICRGQIEKLSRWDRRGRLSYLSLHDPLVAQRYPDLTHERLMREMVVVDRGGRRHGGAEAIRYLSRRLPSLWWLMPLLHLPGTLPLWRFLYRQVANRRYRFGTTGPACSEGSCRLHGPSGQSPAPKA